VSADRRGSTRRGKLVTVVLLVGVIGAMTGLTAAAVPLYRLFCQVTGYGGTTRTAESLPEMQAGRIIEIRFNADVATGLPWRFTPVQRRVEIPIGEQHLAFYRAHNDGARAITGTATFNVTPFKAGAYFTKIDCFCFTEQRLAAGETVDMPVSFFVDPAILDDPDTRDLRTITLSYTFFTLDEPDPSRDRVVQSQDAAS
jgi:cytochrome c oxidase assembly protein subunit 11